MTKEEKKQYLILKEPNIYKGLLILALPLMLNNLIKTLHDIVDMFFIGRSDMDATVGVASIQLTFPVLFTFISLGIGMMVAATALISQLLGSNQKEKAVDYASNILLVSLLLGTLFALLSFTLAPTIMGAMGAEGEYLANSVLYLRIRAFELPFLFGFFAYMGTRQASGDTLTPVLFSVTAILLNIILSPIFIMVLNLGVAGAAYATLIANVVVHPFSILRMFKAKDGITVNLKAMFQLTAISEKMATIKHIFTTAIPASLGQAITAIGFGVMNGVIYSFGPETVAAFGIGNRLLSLILHPVMATGAILSAFIGQNIGALNAERAKETFKKNMLFSVGMMMVGSLLIMFVRAPLAGLFLGDNPVALQMTVDYMFFILLGLPLMAVFQTFIGAYNGSGNTHFTFILSVTRLWLIRIPLVLLFGRLFPERGSQVVWEAMLISNVLIAVLGYILYLKIDFKPKVSLRKKRIKQVTNPQLKTS